MTFKVCFLAVALARPVSAVLLYDVDFNGSLDRVGRPAYTTGEVFPSTFQEHPNSFRRQSDSRVLSSYGDLIDQPLQMLPPLTRQSSVNFTQMDFSTRNFPEGAGLFGEDSCPVWILSFDLILENLQTPQASSSVTDRDRFTLLIDTPVSHRFDFEEGSITFEGSQIGSYGEGVLSHYVFVNDLPTNSVRILQDGFEIYNGQFHFPFPANPEDPTQVAEYRFSYSDESSTEEFPIAVIDNIRISAVPEPSVTILGLSAGFLLLWRFRRTSCVEE